MKKTNNSKFPLYREAGFQFNNLKDIEDVFLSEKENPHEPEKYIYSRYRNPTVVACEKQLAEIEDSEWAILSASGMAAIDMAINIIPEAKKMLFFSEIYGGTLSYINFILKDLRDVDFELFYPENNQFNLFHLEELLSTNKYGLLYFEAVSNPFLIVSDGNAIIKMAKKYGVKIVVDNTFATPYLWKPLDFGADLVLHSVTKYLSGHGSITAGVVCGNDKKLLHQAIEYRKWTGAILSPDDASRTSEQLETFSIRMQKQCDNALELAHYLENHSQISKVLYPGLEKDNSHVLAKQMFENKGYGAMISFEITGKNDDDKKQKVIEYLQKSKDDIPIIPTLGETRTMQMPIYAVWKDRSPSPSYIRLSVGIENIEQLKKKFDKALV